MSGQKKSRITRRARRNEVDTVAASNSNDINVTETKPHTHICNKCLFKIESTDQQNLILKQKADIKKYKNQLIITNILLKKTKEECDRLDKTAEKYKANLQVIEVMEHLQIIKLSEPKQEMGEGKDTKGPIPSTSTWNKSTST